MSYVQLPTRTTSDANSAADINTLQANIEALKGGAGSAAPLSDIATLVNSVALVGEIKTYAGAAAPSGFLLCDGKTLGDTGSGADYEGNTYKALYDLLNEAVGRWENSGTLVWASGDKVKLPNLQDAFLRGEVGGTSSIFTDSAKRSAGIGKKQDDSMQGHYHEVWWKTRPAAQGGDTNAYANDGSTFVTQSAIEARTIITDGTNGTPRISAETRPKNIGVTYIIKY